MFDQDRGDAAPLTATFEYLIDQRGDENIVFIAHLGDVVENALASEFAQADPVFKILDRARFAVQRARRQPRHRRFARTTPRGASPYLDTFGPQRFRWMPTYGGSTPNGYNSYHVFRAAGRQWLLLAMDWRPSDASFAWARRVIKAHPKLPVILTTHELVYADARQPGRVLLRPRQPGLGPTGRRQRPDLPHPQRPLLAARPCRPGRTPPATTCTCTSPTTRTGTTAAPDDPAVPLRPGPQHDRRRDDLARGSWSRSPARRNELAEAEIELTDDDQPVQHPDRLRRSASPASPRCRSARRVRRQQLVDSGHGGVLALRRAGRGRRSSTSRGRATT